MGDTARHYGVCVLARYKEGGDPKTCDAMGGDPRTPVSQGLLGGDSRTAATDGLLARDPRTHVDNGILRKDTGTPVATSLMGGVARTLEGDLRTPHTSVAVGDPPPLVSKWRGAGIGWLVGWLAGWLAGLVGARVGFVRKLDG